jgi:hypothetical protein
MAGPLLQTLQKVGFDDITFRCKSLANIGTVLTYTTDAGFVEKVAGNPDAVLTKAAGILMSNVTARGVASNITLGDDTGTSNEPRNFNANETPQSGVCRLLKHGIIETAQVSGVFGQGSGAYLGPNGIITTAVGVGATELIGHALTGARNGFVRIFVNIV